MLFNSHVFIFVFLPLVLWLWWRWREAPRWRLILLMLASYVFYGYWSWPYIGLMVLSTVIDFHAGQRIHAASDKRRKRRWLVVSIVANLSILCVFKYASFALANANALLELLGVASGARLGPFLELALPVGISFYTFQSMSYSIDIYRGDAEPARDFWSFGAYVAMFPQLVAGPIIRYSAIHEQFRALPRRLRPSTAYLGIQFFVLGLSKKLLIADMVAPYVDALLRTTGQTELLMSWLAMLGYTLQIYFDFSGYSDMAVGLGYLLGFSIPQNFDSPYKSRSISEFWRRWHMTLSFWLRDYLYISLGGSRGGQLKTLRNLVITMFLGGLWHGAAWTFVVWGLWHGLLLVINHLWRRTKIALPWALAWFMTQLAVIVGWVFFRAEDFGMAQRVLRSMFGLGEIDPTQLLGLCTNLYARALAGLGIAPLPAGVGRMSYLLVFVPLGWFVALACRNTWEHEADAKRWKTLALVVLFVLCVLRLTQPSPFLYFQF